VASTRDTLRDATDPRRHRLGAALRRRREPRGRCEL